MVLEREEGDFSTFQKMRSAVITLEERTKSIPEVDVQWPCSLI